MLANGSSQNMHSCYYFLGPDRDFWFTSATLGSRSVDGLDVVSDEALVVAGPVIDGVPVFVGVARAQLVTPLPKEVRGIAGGCPGRLLPWLLDGAVVFAGAI